MSEKKAKDAEKKPKEAKEAKEAPAAAESAEPKKGGGKLKIIIIAVVAMLLGGGGSFAVMKFVLAPKAPVVSAEGSSGEPAEAGEDEEEEEIVAPSKAKSGHGESAPAEGHGAKAESGGHGEPSGHGGGEGEAVVDDGPQSVELKPFTTNLMGPSGRAFLKVILSMEVESQEVADELNKMMPDIRDSILMLLSSLSSEDVSTYDGKERLKSQILNRANSFMPAGKGKVKKVKYSEFIIQ